MGIIESLVTTILTKKVYDYVTGAKERKPSFSERMAKAGATTAPRILLDRINVAIDETYQRFSAEDFQKTQMDEVRAKCVAEFSELSPSEQEQIKHLYNRIGGYTAWHVRLDLLRFLLDIEENHHGSVQFMIHNELLYMINDFRAYGEREIMLKKVCCFLDAEFYFLQGDFVSSLRRLYDAINWDKILENPWLYDICDSNGLEEFYTCAVMNIINIYALLGLSDKADQTRSVFNTLYQQAVQVNQGCDEISRKLGSTPSYDAYRTARMRALSTSTAFVGFHSLRGDSYREEMFDSYVLGVIGGEVVYDISPSLCYEVTYESNGETPVMKIKAFGAIGDYRKKIEMARETIDDRLYRK